MKKNYYFTLVFFLFFTIINAQNSALQISGNNYFSANNRAYSPSYYLDSNSFTIEYDFYLNSFTDFNARISSFANNAVIARPIHFYINSLGNSTLLLGNGTTEESVPGMPSFNQQMWYHIAFVVDNSASKNVKVFVNGIPTVDYNFTTTLDGFSGLTYINLGATRFSSSTNTGDAKFDNLRIWSSARTPTEIASNYASCLTGNETNLISFFNFDRYTGLFIKNLANNSITNKNFPVWSTYSYVPGNGCSTTPLFSPINISGPNFSGVLHYVGLFNGKPRYRTDNLDLDCSDQITQAMCGFTPYYYEIVWENNQWELNYNKCLWELGETCVSFSGSTNHVSDDPDPLSINSADTPLPPCSGWSSSYNACANLSLENSNLEKNIQVYPNPTTGIINLSVKNEASVEIFNLSGLKIYHKKINAGKTTIDISKYQAGLYVLKIKSEQGTITKKILKK